MTFVVAIIVLLVACVSVVAMRGRRDAIVSIGWMSEQWLSEHRASHSR